jgi:hypothetical protein
MNHVAEQYISQERLDYEAQKDRKGINFWFAGNYCFSCGKDLRGEIKYEDSGCPFCHRSFVD